MKGGGKTAEFLPFKYFQEGEFLIFRDKTGECGVLSVAHSMG